MSLFSRLAALAVLALPPAVAALAVLGLPASAVALPLISEVFYDAVGSDDGLVFIEILGSPGVDVSGWVIEGVNGANGSVTVSIVLAGTIPPDGVLVVGDDAGAGSTLVPGADLVRDFDFQNGPDGVVLRAGAVVFDALGYGAFGSGDVFPGEGRPAPDAPAGSSVARLFADVDTNDNGADFVVLGTPTPGVAPRLDVAEPSSAWLLGVGLGLGALRVRRP